MAALSRRRRPPGWNARLAHPVRLREGGELVTLSDARAYAVALPEPYQRRSAWQGVAHKLMEAAAGIGTIAAATSQLELALLMENRLWLPTMPPPTRRR